MNLNQSIVIIDYGVGNVHSVLNSIKWLGYKKISVTAEEKKIRESDSIVLPGVGAFDKAMSSLKEKNLIPVLKELASVKKKPVLGICLGMQILADDSEENGLHEGLGLVKGNIKKLILPEAYSVPHVGWNNVKFRHNDIVFSLNKNDCHFYFDHSYHFEGPEENISAWCEYGKKITAAIQKENIHGVQFHPEKSQTNGLKLFRSFFNYTDQC